MSVANTGHASPPGGEALARDFGARVREARELRGLSRDAFSAKCGIATLAALERGERAPHLSDVIGLCNGIPISPNVLLRPYLPKRG
ncbi:MAG: helix-turn-helix domain-containing protein [Solirubrobacterales bacterium]